MTARTVHVPYTVEQDEDGVWCARAEVHPGVVAYGNGQSEQAALDDLREGIIALLEEFGAPRELAVPMPVAA